MSELKPCPFCGGKAKISWVDVDYGGQSGRGDRKNKYRFQVICNRCHSRGKPVKSDWLINCNPWSSRYTGRNYGESQHVDEQTDMIKPYVDAAISAWNDRKELSRDE